MKTFPITQIPHPVVSRATNAGDTYVEKITDSTVESKTDAGYRLTRPRNTRMPRTFLYAWTCLSEAQKIPFETSGRRFESPTYSNLRITIRAIPASCALRVIGNATTHILKGITYPCPLRRYNL